jgi:hypothetical protein
MARTKVTLGSGVRPTDYLSTSLLARIYPATVINELLDAHQCNSRRERSFRNYRNYRGQLVGVSFEFNYYAASLATTLLSVADRVRHANWLLILSSPTSAAVITVAVGIISQQCVDFQTNQANSTCLNY